MNTVQEQEFEYLQGRARGLQELLNYVVGAFASRSLSPEGGEDTEITEILTKASNFYVDEMMRCLSCNAFLAATVMGASVLESVLSLACVSEKSKTQNTKAWQSLKGRKAKPFKTVLLKAHLPDLLAIGQELKWFPSKGIPPKLRDKLTQISNDEAVAKLCGSENSEISIPEFLMAGSASLRNLLHPGRSSETSLELLEYLSLFGCICVLMSLGCLAETK